MQSMSDGFLRLPLDAVLSIQWIHLLSGLDDINSNGTGLCGQATSLTGYTEWLSASAPIVTLGWDWAMGTRNGESHCVRTSLPRTNLMLVDGRRHDYGWTINLEAMALVVDTMPWKSETCRAVNQRYV
jgi:hypothetical protein